MSLTVVPTTFAEACEFVRTHHRHHAPPPGHLFSIAAADDAGDVVGVAIVGRPVARMIQDGFTAEVTRVATDGTEHACSCLYGAAWRAVKAMSYRRLITYTQDSETGSSLRGAGWRVVAHRPPRRGWNVPGRPRVDTHPTLVGRTLWEADDDYSA